MSSPADFAIAARTAFVQRCFAIEGRYGNDRVRTDGVAQHSLQFGKRCRLDTPASCTELGANSFQEVDIWDRVDQLDLDFTEVHNASAAEVTFDVVVADGGNSNVAKAKVGSGSTCVDLGDRSQLRTAERRLSLRRVQQSGPRQVSHRS